mgnify:CR=1 FL=1
MSIISQTAPKEQNTMELLEKVSSLEAQVVALQASEAKLEVENEVLQMQVVEGVEEIVKLSIENDPEREEYHAKNAELLKAIANKSKALIDQLETKLKIASIDMNKVKSKMVFFEKLYKREKEENERILDRGSQVASDLFIENEKLKADNEKLFQFIIQVNGTEEHVEKMIVERMSKEFIDGNQDWWDQMELFQED